MSDSPVELALLIIITYYVCAITDVNQTVICCINQLMGLSSVMSDCINLEKLSGNKQWKQWVSNELEKLV